MAVDGRLLSLRSVYFFFVAGASGLVRFLIILLKDLGYNAFQIGILSATRPFCNFVGSFFWGYIGDVTDARLSVLIVGTFFSCIGLSALLFNKIQNNIYYTGATIMVSTFIGAVNCLLDAITIVILQETSTTPNNCKKNDLQQSENKHIKESKQSKQSKESQESQESKENENNVTKASEKEKTKSGTYGATRLWGAVGWGLGAFVCGLLVTYFGENFIIYFYDANLALAISVLMFVFPCAVKSAANKSKSSQAPLLSNDVSNVSNVNNINNINDASNINANIKIVNKNEASPDESKLECKDEVKDLPGMGLLASPILHFEKNDDIGDFDNYVKEPNQYKKRHANKVMDSDVKKKSLLSEFFGMITTLSGFVFFVNLIGFGVAMSFVENYLFLFIMDKLDGPVYLCGLTISVMVLGEVPMFAASDFLLKRVGILGLLAISHAAYALRVFGYTMLPEHKPEYSYFILLLEPLHGLTYAGMWLASVEYGARLVPSHLQGTMQGLLSGLYIGLADSIGCVVGGWIFDRFGPIWMYRITGSVIFVWMFIFQIVFRISLRCKKKSKPNAKDFDYSTIANKSQFRMLHDEEQAKHANEQEEEKPIWKSNFSSTNDRDPERGQVEYSIN